MKLGSLSELCKRCRQEVPEDRRTLLETAEQLVRELGTLFRRLPEISSERLPSSESPQSGAEGYMMQRVNRGWISPELSFVAGTRLTAKVFDCDIIRTSSGSPPVVKHLNLPAIWKRYLRRRRSTSRQPTSRRNTKKLKAKWSLEWNQNLLAREVVDVQNSEDMARELDRIIVGRKGEERLTAILDWAVRRGLPIDFVKHMIVTGVLTPKGRRVTNKRVLAVRALEARIQQGISWSKLPELFCDCGAPIHDRNCRERLRKLVGALDSFLRSNQIFVTPPIRK
jgi:hypothetical protein